MPAVLERKPSKYDKLTEELRIPSYQRRNVELVVHNDSVPRRKEVVRDETEETPLVGNDKELFNF
jgi:hypothetical protein